MTCEVPFSLINSLPFLTYGIFFISDFCEGCMERVHRLAIERHGAIIQVHGQTCAALEGCIS